MQTLSKNILERGAEFLKQPEVLARMDSETQNAIREGRKEFITADFYIRKKVAGFAGIIDLIQPTDDKKVGVTNLDKGKLPLQGSYMAVVCIGLSYGFSNAQIAPIASELRYASSEYLNNLPVKLVNSEFKLLVQDKPLLNARTKKFFANAYADYGVEANDENAVLLSTPKLIDSNKAIKAQLEFAEDTLGAPAGQHFIEVRIIGVMIADRV